LLRYLRGMVDLPGRPSSFHRPGPLPLRPGELCAALCEWAGAESCREGGRMKNIARKEAV
jgi:2-oxoglutarate ferredoxin oxidoreductase subunit alpha